MNAGPRTDEQLEPGFDRRAFLRRTAVVGSAVWVAPTVQSLMSPAFAAGTPQGGCTACLDGGGQQVDGEAGATVTYNGAAAYGVTIGVGGLCCTPPGNANTSTAIEVTAHAVAPRGPSSGDAFHFDTLTSLTCSKEAPSPAPPPHTAECANVFTGTATDGAGNTLSFVLEDHGEPGANADMLSLTIRDSNGNVILDSSGPLTNGNLQVHDGIKGLVRDCTGC